MARPTKLTPELREKAGKYLDTCNDEIHTTDKGAISYVEVQLPSIVGLARFLEINKDTVYEWSKQDTMFSDIVKGVLAEQEIRLLNNGLGGLYTSKALGALLSKHGYNEKIESDITSKGESIAANSPAVLAAEAAYLAQLDGTPEPAESA